MSFKASVHMHRGKTEHTNEHLKVKEGMHILLLVELGNVHYGISLLNVVMAI